MTDEQRERILHYACLIVRRPTGVIEQKDHQMAAVVPWVYIAELRSALTDAHVDYMTADVLGKDGVPMG